MAGFYDLAESLLERRRALLEKSKRNSTFPEDSFIPSKAKEELQKRFAAMKRGGTPELLREGAQEMYENPIVNTAIGIAPGAGDVQSAFEAWKSAKEGKYLEAGLNLAGAAPVIPSLGAFAGIFAGKGAKTADLPKLFEAQKMAEKGATREEIWDKTGWFQGPDKQWKFEIPDYKAEFKPTPAFFTQKEGVRQGTVFHHPEFQSAGYGTENIMTKRGTEEGGSFMPVLVNNELVPAHSDIQIGTTAVKETPMGFSFSPLTAKNINLHELQHAVQYQENFAKGGTPENMYAALVKEHKEKLADEHDALLARFMELKEKYQNVPISEIPKNIQNEVSQLKPKISALQKSFHNYARKAEVGIDFTKEELYDAYKRLAGETEARLVQKRMQMTPEELKANPPWTMYDVPEERQIVQFENEGRMLRPKSR